MDYIERVGMKEWFLPRELAGLAGMPADPSNVTKKAKKEGWKRQNARVKGGGFEYHISSLPPETQSALRERETKRQVSDSDSINAQIQQLQQDLNTLKSQVSTPQSPWESLSEQEQTLIRLFRNATEIGKIAILAAAHGAEKKVPAQNQVAC